ncbi:short-chain dehydrogenase/reductase SDR [Scenedesmus sp. NREL 46B-D3]|nr:short-chain dehydrogenase/reductase SDR [Scenedesmus sp. NREL 46B-D3]
MFPCAMNITQQAIPKFSSRSAFSPRQAPVRIKLHKLAIMAAATPEKVDKQIKPQEADQQPHQPGMEVDMDTKPIYIRDSYKGSGKLQGKVAIITGGDSGIGRCHVAILYLDEHKDADEVVELVKKEGRQCLKFSGDVSKPETAGDVVGKVVQELGRLDILVNNASVQHMALSLEDITPEQLQETFAVNVFGYFYMAQVCAARVGASVAAPQGSPFVPVIATLQSLQVAFTRALSNQLVSKNIRVNAVAPGPIWTPLIPATFPKVRLARCVSREMIDDWKSEAQMKRPGQPCEVAPCYVFLASEDGSYISGQTLHPNGGTVVSS